MKSLFSLTERRIRSPITVSYSLNEKCDTKRQSRPEKVNFITRKGHNTVIIATNGQNLLSYCNQIGSRG